jgi:hypothetical protein
VAEVLFEIGQLCNGRVECFAVIDDGDLKPIDVRLDDNLDLSVRRILISMFDDICAGEQPSRQTPSPPGDCLFGFQSSSSVFVPYRP